MYNVPEELIEEIVKEVSKETIFFSLVVFGSYSVNKQNH
jgi:hypothetical protein